MIITYNKLEHAQSKQYMAYQCVVLLYYALLLQLVSTCTECMQQ